MPAKRVKRWCGEEKKSVRSKAQKRLSMLNINTHVGQVKEGKGEAKEKIGPDGRDGSNISTHCRTGEGGSRWQPLLLG